MKDREMQHIMQMAAARQENKVSAQNVGFRCPHKMQERLKKQFSSMRRETGHLRLKLVTFCCENMCTSDSYSLGHRVLVIQQKTRAPQIDIQLLIEL